MNSDEVQHQARRLRDYAEHFVQRDWNYTRNHDIKHIRYVGDWSGYKHPARRLARTLRQFLAPRSGVLRALDLWPWRHPIITIRAGLRTAANLPDGVLDDGGVIVVWEEVGEYLQYVQPSVGSLLANWMEAEPNHPHAVRIAAEMQRIEQAYAARLRESDQ